MKTLLALCFLFPACAFAGTAVIVNSDNSSGIDIDTVKKIYLGSVDLCCTYFTQQYMGSHIIENASDTMLA